MLHSSQNSKLTGSLTFTPETGAAVSYKSIGSFNGFAFGTLEITATAAANSWVTLGTLSKYPTEAVTVPCVRTGNGTFSGMVKISQYDGVKLYTTQALSGNAVGFTFSYMVANS